MNGHPTNEEREALIAGEAAKSLASGEADELSLLAGLLGDPSTWAEPATELEQRAFPAPVDHFRWAKNPTPVVEAFERWVGSLS